MQQPLFNTPVAKCETLARHVVASIRRYIAIFAPTAEVQAELEGIAARIGAGSAQLVSAQGVYRERVLDLIEPRVEVKMVDLKADDVVRAVKRMAEDAKVADRIFPYGVMPIVKPVGQSEVDELQKLEERISGSIGWTDKDAAQARIASVRAEYETALARRRAALSASGSARALRDSTRELAPAFTTKRSIPELPRPASQLLRRQGFADPRGRGLLQSARPGPAGPQLARVKSSAALLGRRAQPQPCEEPLLPSHSKRLQQISHRPRNTNKFLE